MSVQPPSYPQQGSFGPPAPAFRPAEAPQSAPPVAGRDPLRPFGAVPAAEVSINDFAPPRPKAPLVIAIIAAVVALVVALFVITWTRPTTPAPGASPAAQPTASASPSWGMPFSSSDNRRSGEWQILSSAWTDQGLRVQVRVLVDHGPIQVVFFAYTNDAVEAIDPLPSQDFPGVDGTTMDNGDDRTGWLVFPMAPSDTTVVLADYWNEQMSALPVPA